MCPDLSVEKRSSLKPTTYNNDILTVCEASSSIRKLRNHHYYLILQQEQHTTKPIFEQLFDF